MSGLDAEHRCFGCGRLLEDGDPHIHVGIDPLGLDDLLTVVFCEPCTEKSDDGWQAEAHQIERGEP